MARVEHEIREALVADIRRGLERDAFEPVFQPIARLSDGALAGFEALARWRREPDVLTSPSAFLEAAIERDLLSEISRRILFSATERLGGWRAEGAEAIFMSVNIAGRDLEGGALVADVAEATARARLPEGVLRVEVTEHQILRDPDVAARELAALQAAGVKILFDDFGAGFSSLSWLTRLPCDGIKFDQALVADIGAESVSRKILRAMIRLAQDLGIVTIAEGVETAAQRDVLTDLGCDYAQGHLYARALGAEAAHALIFALDREGETEG